jgi:hypothetical protein
MIGLYVSNCDEQNMDSRAEQLFYVSTNLCIKSISKKTWPSVKACKLIANFP